MNEKQLSGYPITIYYAFKQSEGEDDGNKNEDNGSLSSFASTGWETMLEGLLRSHVSVVGTWPISTEMTHRLRSIGSNTLASSIVLVCRPRPHDAISVSRREFLSSLKRELDPAVRELQQGSIAPVDLAQAAIGPGMAVFSRL